MFRKLFNIITEKEKMKGKLKNKRKAIFSTVELLLWKRMNFYFFAKWASGKTKENEGYKKKKSCD